MRVNNNPSSFSVFKYYERATSQLARSMEHLSSGLRIVRPGDDAAGLAMSEKFRAQVLNTNMAINNISNMVSMVQTEDGWLQNIHDMLHRMAELYTESIDGTKSNADRINLQTEFRQIQAEISAITTGTTARGKYNSVNLFQTNSSRIQVGPDYGQTFGHSVINLQTNYSLWIGNYSGGTASTATAGADVVKWHQLFDMSIKSAFANLTSKNLGKINVAVVHIAKVRATLGAYENRLKFTSEGLRNYAENIGNAESIIRDVNVALETTKYTRHQILVQVGTAMLAQANAMPQSVLSLIGGR
jgi:flagellin